MKKVLSLIFIVAFILIGSVAFVACGNGKTGDEVYNLYKSQLESLLDSGTPFASQTRNQVTSNFMLQKFNKKTSNSTLVDYGWQDELIALGLNYIEMYYPLTQNAQKSFSVSKIKTSFEDLQDSFAVLKEEYQTVLQISDSESMTIYNGFMANYADEATEFAKNVYKCALQLKTHLSNNLKVDATVGNQNTSYDAFEFYLQSQILEIYNDYNNLLMENCKASFGSVASNILSLQSFAKNLAVKYPQTIDTSKIKVFFNALSEERALTYKALEKFSYYDYVKTYNQDVDAYEKTVSHANAYLQQIERYFYVPTYLTKDNYMSKTILYIMQILGEDEVKNRLKI